MTRSSLRSRLVLAGLVVAVVIAVFLLRSPAADPPEAGGAPGSPEDSAPVEPVPLADFCAGFDALANAQLELISSNGTPGAEPPAVAARQAAEDLAELGAGTVMPPEAKAGLTYILEVFLALDDDATSEDLARPDMAASIDDSANADAFSVWLNQSCVPGGGPL